MAKKSGWPRSRDGESSLIINHLSHFGSVPETHTVRRLRFRSQIVKRKGSIPTEPGRAEPSRAGPSHSKKRLLPCEAQEFANIDLQGGGASTDTFISLPY